MDTSALKVGQRWANTIHKAIEQSAFVLACFSDAYGGRDTYMDTELDIALKVHGAPSEDRPWLLPVLLSGVDIPRRQLGDGSTLASLHHIELYAGWDRGVRAVAEHVARDQDITRERRRSSALELVLRARSPQVEPSASLRLLLASEAVRSTWVRDGLVVPGAESSLHDAVGAAPPFRLTLPRHRHTHRINTVDFSPDGRMIVTAAWDETVRLWSVETGRGIRRIDGHEDVVVSARFSSEGKSILSASFEP